MAQEVDRELFAAVEERDHARVKRCLEVGANALAPLEHGVSAFGAAAFHGNCELLELFLARGASPSARDGLGATPLLHAVRGGQQEALMLLLARGAKLTEQLADEKGAIHVAATHDGEALIPVLVKLGLSVDAVDDAGRTPLHLAADRHCPEVITALVAAGASVNREDRSGMTPLDHAVMGSDPLVLDALVEGGAVLGALDAMPEAALRGSLQALRRLARDEPLSRVEGGLTLLHLAARARDRELIAALVKSRVPVNATDEAGNTALHLAAGEADAPVVRALLDAGADATAVNAYGQTPLHMLSFQATVEAAQLLVERGGKGDARDAEGRTPFEMALEHQRLPALEALATVFEPAPDEVYGEGWTAVHFAAAFGSASAIAALKGRGLLEEKSDDGMTVLHQAAGLGVLAGVEALVKAGLSPDVRGAGGATPLHGVADEATAEKLLALGADPAVKDEGGRTPLTAAKERQLELVAARLGR
jgi:ankyrin repeat protein